AGAPPLVAALVQLPVGGGRRPRAVPPPSAVPRPPAAGPPSADGPRAAGGEQGRARGRHVVRARAGAHAIACRPVTPIAASVRAARLELREARPDPLRRRGPLSPGGGGGVPQAARPAA